MDNSKESGEEEASSPRPEFSPLSIARTLWKRKTYILTAWLLLSGCTVFVVHKLPSVYKAESVVLVDSQKIPEKFVSATVPSDLEDRIATIREQLLSSGELKRIIDQYGLYKEQRKTHFEEEILEMMRKDISIKLEPFGSDRRPGAFRIGYQGPDPVVVTRVANRLTDIYVEQNLKTREGQAEGTSEFLDAQLREAKNRLDQLEAAVSAYKLKHNGELPEQEQSLESALSRFQVELEANRDAINRAQETKVILSTSLSSMEANLAAQTRHVAPVTAADDMAGLPRVKRSEVLQQQLDTLRTRYSDDYPDVIRVRAELERVKQIEAQEEKASASAAPPKASQPRQEGASARPAPVVESAAVRHIREQIAGVQTQIAVTEKELDDHKVQQQRILREIDTYQNRIEQLPVREQEMAQLTRDYEMSKENYKSLLDKKMAAEMALDMERRQKSERFTVLDRAKVPPKPIKPNRPLLYSVGTVAGLIIALITGFFLELRQDVFLGEWELPGDTTILARLPYIEVPVSPKPQPTSAARL